MIKSHAKLFYFSGLSIARKYRYTYIEFVRVIVRTSVGSINSRYTLG